MLLKDLKLKFVMLLISILFRTLSMMRLRKVIKEEFKADNIEKLIVSPAFITQGGPKCVAIQAIKI